MTPGSVMAPMTRSSPPQVGHVLKSMANTRFTRAIQLIGLVRSLDGDSSSVAALVATLGRATMAALSRALGANTP
ncbi:MAG: hypothetical protein ACI9W2_002898 [Gammaproteobacteria bacterium]|jgi:hypothetical protein